MKEWEIEKRYIVASYPIPAWMKQVIEKHEQEKLNEEIKKLLSVPIKAKKEFKKYGISIFNNDMV